VLQSGARFVSRNWNVDNDMSGLWVAVCTSGLCCFGYGKALLPRSSVCFS
jgi:hypothetical protein